VGKAPWKPLALAPATVETRRLADGGLVLRSPQELLPYPRCLGELLCRWAREAPARTFLAERPAGGDLPAAGSAPAPALAPNPAESAGGWRRITYRQALAAVERIAAALLARGLGPERGVAVLSENGVDNALLQLAAMHVGIPVVPISPAYSLQSQDHAQVRYILAQTAPGLVYAADGASYRAALAACAGVHRDGCELAVSAHPPGDRPATAFGDLLGELPGQDGRAGEPEGRASSGQPVGSGRAVAARFAEVGPDTIAKILFTSGSTGRPKGVLTTQRMLCSNQQAAAQLWPFLAERPPVIVDWLPWSHTFGGSFTFNMILRNGGTLYIDGGKPLPGLIETTVRNLREVPSTLYFNVPRGYDVLLPFVERDEELRETFFRELDGLFYGAASLPQHLWEQLERLATAATGRRVPIVAGWGSTETAPAATIGHFFAERAGVIGLPLPGTEIKLAPVAGKLELRVKGPNVTPGYWRHPALTRERFDEDGFFMMGDAGKLADPDDPARGIVFDGRLAENFKLLSGCWVHVGELRTEVISAGAPVIQDVVVTGHDRRDIGLLVFPSLAGCRMLCGEGMGEAPLGDLIGRPEVRDKLLAGLAAHNAANPTSSRRIARALLLAEPPSIDAGEITDKGYVNQRAVRERRAELVELLHGGSAGGGAGPGPEGICLLPAVHAGAQR
jgi:feruloyl-CoA synthase